MTTIILGIFEEGLVYTVMALDVYIIRRTLNFPDLFADGTPPSGTAFTATDVAGGFIHPATTLPLPFLLGTIAGCVTGLIHVRLRVRDLLSEIIVVTTLYSINLRVTGKSNLPIFGKDTIFSSPRLERITPQALKPYTVTTILLVIILICKLLLDIYLKTRSGYLLKVVGDNDALMTSLTKDKGVMGAIGLAIANRFVALAGSVYCQQKGFFKISIDTGTIVTGLTNVIIGIQLFKRFGFVKSIMAVIIDSIIYKVCVPLTLLLRDLILTFGNITVSFPVTISDLGLITLILFPIILVVSFSRGKKVKSHA